MLDKYIRFRNYMKFMRNTYKGKTNNSKILDRMDEERFRLFNKDIDKEKKVDSLFDNSNNLKPEDVLLYNMMKSNSNSMSGRVLRVISHSYLTSGGAYCYMIYKVFGLLAILGGIMSLITLFSLVPIIFFGITLTVSVVSFLVFIRSLSKNKPVPFGSK